MVTRAGKTSFPHSGVLLRIVSIFAVLLSAGCGDRGEGYIIEPGAGGPGLATDTTPPAVLSTSPGANDTAIPINAALSVSFSETIAPSSVTGTSFVVRDPSNNIVSGSLNCNGVHVTFTPSNWLNISTNYTVTLTTGIADIAGNHLANTNQWTFTTDSRSDFTRPTITGRYPANTQVNVPLTSTITVTFSEAIDPATVNASTVTITSGGEPVDVNLSVNGPTLIVVPTSILKFRTTYTVCVKNDVTDLAGNAPLYDQYWNFTTADNSGFFNPYIAVPTGSWPEAVAIGDVTGDGKNDVVLVTSFYSSPHDFSVFLFVQNEQGGLATAVTCTTIGTYANYPHSLAIGDINNDGRSEIVVGYGTSNIEVFIYTDSGSLVSVATYSSINTAFVRIGDLNHDGLLDVVGIGSGSNTAAVFLQNTYGTLDLPVTYAVTHGGSDDLEVGDINNDGLADIVVMSGQQYAYPNLGVLTQRPDGTFDPAVYYDLGGSELTRGVAIGDVNGDSLNDIIVTYDGNVAVFHQNKVGTLDPATKYPGVPGPVDIADVNADGRQDIITLHDGWSMAHIFLQNADGFIGAGELYNIPYATWYNPHGIAVGDINSDGSNDLIVADYNNGLVILYHK